MSRTAIATAPLSIEAVTKVYPGDVRANDEVSLEIGAGRVFGLLGPNGAGKTTLVNQVIGQLRPTSGSIRLGDVELSADAGAARALCSYLPQQSPPIQSLRTRFAIELVARIRGVDRERARARAEELLATLELEPWADQLGSALSGGVQRLVGFAMAAAAPGRIVVLDEPTNDVDPLRRRLLWREIRRLADGGSSVLLVTHNVLEAERAVDELAVIDGGRVLASGTPSALKRDARDSVRLVVSLEPEAGVPSVPAFGDQQSVTGRRLTVVLREADAVHALHWARALVEDGVAEEYELGATTLEDSYARLVGPAADADHASAEEVPVA
ncbi:MAG: ABC transporter ATP-binding protein [Chloroflexi bacterium]|nr:ABC transporter ATP-binding protein [Chloroflexota bacterium]MDA1147138.1 ABC transporter ATP-binding protein [Chloroflexota bacterium]